MAAVSFTSIAAFAQSKDEIVLEKIYKQELRNDQCYKRLSYLCKRVGPRLSGSPQAAAAVEWAKQTMQTMGLDSVYLQEVMVPHWVRGDKEEASMLSSKIPGGLQSVPVTALGGSIGTGPDGITGDVVEVQSLQELDKLGKKVKGKIVFFNRPMDAGLVNTFEAYGKAVDQRGRGPALAAKYGAIGAIVRSMSPSLSDLPHTGSTHFGAKDKNIPSIAISTNGADLLSSLLKKDDKMQFYFKTSCEILPDEKSYNVIGEIRGTDYPNEVISVGGHLDSWDLAEGANDDGTGCVQSMEVLSIFKALNMKPKRTIRAVMFMNEENGLRGGTKYFQTAKTDSLHKYIVALETDRGGFTPRGFSFDTTAETIKKYAQWQDLFKPYGLEFTNEGSGADIYQMKAIGTLCMELIPDSQRYFDIHHDAADTIANVNERELSLGAAGLASMIYLFSEYGIVTQ